MRPDSKNKIRKSQYYVWKYELVESTKSYLRSGNKSYQFTGHWSYGTGHEAVPVLLPGFVIIW